MATDQQRGTSLDEITRRLLHSLRNQGDGEAAEAEAHADAAEGEGDGSSDSDLDLDNEVMPLSRPSTFATGPGDQGPPNQIWVSFQQPCN